MSFDCTPALQAVLDRASERAIQRGGRSTNSDDVLLALAATRDTLPGLVFRTLDEPLDHIEVFLEAQSNLPAVDATDLLHGAAGLQTTSTLLRALLRVPRVERALDDLLPYEDEGFDDAPAFVMRRMEECLAHLLRPDVALADGGIELRGVRDELTQLLESWGFGNATSRLDSYDGPWIRFELAPSEVVPRWKAVAQALLRSSEMFEAAFGEDDSGYLIASGVTDQNARDEFESVVPSTSLVSLTETVDYWDDHATRVDDPEAPENAEMAVALRPRDSGWQRLLLSIVGTDHGMADYRWWRTWFINRDKRLAMYVYDDRGCDVFGASVEDIRFLYERFNSWILDYDRERIDARFAAPDAGEP